MDNYKVYQWMLAGGLGLKGTSLGIFALVFSYTRCGRTMFESEESLAKCFGYSREHVCVTIGKLVNKGLIHKGERHGRLLTIDYTADITTVARMLSPPTCRDPDMLKAFKESLSKKTLQECEKILQEPVRKDYTVCKKTSQQDVRKPYSVFRTDEGRESIRAYSSIPVLSIDDLGCEPERCCIYGVDYTPIQQILYSRYNHRAPTVITTNLNLQDIKDRYGERMIDRMEETYTRICFDYPSYRSKK